MKYMCLVIIDNSIAESLTEEDWAEINANSLAYDRSLMDRGVYIRAEALHGRETARTVRVRKGDALVTDGPFIEAKEQVAGFILVDVSDAEAAMEIARGIPLAKIGAVEVRPVMDFGEP
jgi:hypothetical protein